MTYQELQAALAEFDLPSRISWRQLKERHRELVRRYHPDHAGDGADPEKIQRVNAAYKVLHAYCSEYQFDFSRQEFLEQCPEERLREQFSMDAMWNGGQP